MHLKPTGSNATLILTGTVLLNHQYEKFPLVSERLKMHIEIPDNYPNQEPIFKEIGGVFPKSGDYHINPDGSLCLGSPFRIKLALSENNSFNVFFKFFFIPYAYASILKLRHEIGFIFGELSHGSKGEIEDFCELFGVSTSIAVAECLSALSIKKRIANKKKCPCGCSGRLGTCEIHLKLNVFRKKLPRSWFREKRQRLSLPSY